MRKSSKDVLLAAVVCLVLFGTLQMFRTSVALHSEVATASTSNNPCAITLSSETVRVPGGVINISFAAGEFDVPETIVVNWVKRAAVAVSTFYGRFPVAHARLRIVPVEGEDGVYRGVTIGQDGAFTRIPLGQHTTAKELEDDWILTHEFVHLAFPDLPKQHRWIEEGLATYVEPIARAQAGQLKPKRVWHDMMRDMPKGEPEPGDKGLDHTHTWARTYWGGALYCLRADLMIRQLTQNRHGLQDALRAIVGAGGTQDKQDWPLQRALRIGDEATATNVLEQLYAEMSAKPVRVDLEDIWKKLGVSDHEGKITFSDSTQFAIARDAITRIPSDADIAAMPSERAPQRDSNVGSTDLSRIP